MLRFADRLQLCLLRQQLKLLHKSVYNVHAHDQSRHAARFHLSEKQQPYCRFLVQAF